MLPREKGSSHSHNTLDPRCTAYEAGDWFSPNEVCTTCALHREFAASAYAYVMPREHGS